MTATDTKSVATEESLRFTLRELAAPILRRKATLSVTFLFVVSITLLLAHLRFQKYQSQSAILAQAALTDAKVAPNTGLVTPGSQSLNEADLDREAKLAEQKYLRYLSTREQDASPNSPIPNVTITIPSPDRLPPAQSTTVIVMIAIVLGLLISLSLTYLVDYCDPCFSSPVQVIRTLSIPLVVAIPKRTS